MWPITKLTWLLFSTIFVSVFEVLSLLGIQLPHSIAIYFYSFFILLVGYRTIWHGIQAIFHFDFSSINLLMVIAVAGAFYLREYPEAAIVIILFTLAEHLEDIGIAKSQSALDHLIEKMPKTVLLKDAQQKIEITRVKIGDIIVIKPGGMVPLDGVVQAGNSYVDESAVTGEPLAKDKRKEDAIFAGTLNKTGILEIVVTKVASDSTIERIREMTFTATQHKAKTQKFIEKFSTYYTPSLLLLAVFWMFFSWFVLHIPFDRAFSAALVLLVISCPCALVISTPISIFSAIGNASSSGALIKGGKYLEIIGQIKAIALDKTRTLTYGEPIVTDVIPFGKSSREVLLSCAAGIEAFSEHPLAQSIVEAAKQEDLELHEIKNFESVFGKGAKAECLICDDQQHLIGKLQFILEEHKVPQEIVQQVEYYQNQGKTVIVVSTPKEVEGIIVVQDMIRSDSRALVTELQALGVQPVMLTGDHENVARAVAKKVGIQDVRANLLPQDKLKEIKDLSNHYGMTAMFGDGVNDAPALAFSSVGISMSALGNDTALEAASIILLNNHLKLIPFLIQLGRKTLRTIQFNTGFAIAIKFLFIGLALLGKTNLAIAIFADVGVTLLVIVNSLRLQQWKPSY